MPVDLTAPWQLGRSGARGYEILANDEYVFALVAARRVPDEDALALVQAMADALNKAHNATAPVETAAPAAGERVQS